MAPRGMVTPCVRGDAGRGRNVCPYQSQASLLGGDGGSSAPDLLAPQQALPSRFRFPSRPCPAPPAAAPGGTQNVGAGPSEALG